LGKLGQLHSNLGEVRNVTINWKNLAKLQQTKSTYGQKAIAPFKFGPSGTSSFNFG